MLDLSKKEAAKALLAGIKPTFLQDVTGEVKEDFNTTSLAQIESGKDYEIIAFGSQAGKVEVTRNNVKQKIDANVIWVDAAEVSTGLPVRIFLGTLKRNMSAAQRGGLLGTFGTIKSTLVGKTIKVSQYENLGRDANDRSIIKIDYTIV